MLLESDVDDYELGPLLGRGGMGEVHIARHRSGKLVAIKHVRKTLSLDPQLCERLTAEARILSRIDHPNVVGVLDGGVSSTGQPFLVMSRVFGTPLDVAIAHDGPFSRDRISAIMSQTLDGLAAIHEAGVIHADLKSSNVLIDELDRVMIIDFGLARDAAHDPADDDVIGGTPAYMAPELLAGGLPSVAADIYAAGVVLYELLTGTVPLARNLSVLVLLHMRLHQSVELPSKRAPERRITATLDDVVERALAIDPEHRFATVRDLADALAVALAAWAPSLEDSPTAFRTRQSRPEHIAPTVRLDEVLEQPTQRIDRSERVITRALGDTSQRVAARDVAGAVTVLEQALAELVPADPAHDIVPEAWRLETVLAALYQSLGKKDRANRLARVAYSHALRTGNPVAQARSQALIVQLASEQTRMARGSRPVPLR